ncbi:odorant receptor 131-2-like isoform 2-T2 [Synchiropus picturatus]
MLPCCFFLYINGVMLLALLRKPVLLESSRYVLFGHLLFTDSLQLLSAMQLYILVVSRVRLIIYGCVVNLLITYFIVKLPPLNLAVMSLERMESSTFTLPNFCTRRAVFRLQAYTTISMVFNFSIFVSVSLIIILTYVAIMSSSVNVRNTKKARRTVLLHFLQLWMCLTSILYPLMLADPQWNSTPTTMGLIRYGLFLVLIIFPKCLSPLIYGLRDKAFRQVFKYYFTFGLRGDTRP